MKTRLIRGLAALGIVAGLGVGLGAATAGATGYGYGYGFGSSVPHGHPYCASDAWSRDNLRGAAQLVARRVDSAVPFRRGLSSSRTTGAEAQMRQQHPPASEIGDRSAGGVGDDEPPRPGGKTARSFAKGSTTTWE